MSGYSAYGAVLKVDTTGDNTPDTEIGNLTSISGPSISADTVDVSSHDSWKHGATIDTCVFDPDNTITADGAAHGVKNGEVIRVTKDGANPTELTEDRWYYVTAAATGEDDEFSLEASPGGGAITFAGDINHTGKYYFAFGYREFAGSMVDGGELTIEGNLTTAAEGNKLLADAMEDRDVLDFSVDFPTGDTWTFKAVVNSFSSEAPYDDKLSFSAGLKVTGRPVFS